MKIKHDHLRDAVLIALGESCRPTNAEQRNLIAAWNLLLEGLNRSPNLTIEVTQGDPRFPRSDWALAVEQEETDLGFAEWVEQRLRESNS